MSIENRLAELGIALPEPAAPVAAYVPTVEANGLLHVSGQVSFGEDETSSRAGWARIWISKQARPRRVGAESCC